MIVTDTGGVVRDILIRGECPGFPVKFIEPAAQCAHPEDTGAVLENRADNIMTEAGGITGSGLISGKCFVIPVELIEPAAVGTDPEYFGAVFIDGQDSVVTDAGGIAGLVFEAGKGFCFPVESIQPVIRSDPQHAQVVLANTADGIVAQAGGVSPFSSEMGIFTGFWVKLIEPAVKCSYPEKTGSVLMDGQYIVMTEAIGVIGDLPVHGKFVPVVFIKSILGAEPHKSFAVLQYTFHDALGQAFFDGEAVEPDNAIIREKDFCH